MKVVFSKRAFASVMAETAEKVTTETGGLFLGQVIDDTWYIVEAIDPGPKSIFEIAYFEYDQQYTQHLINKIANLYESRLDLIGLWHRHPGSFDQFSSTDDGTNAKYASMRPEGAISGLVNLDPEFRFTMYHVTYPARYRKIPYEVGDELIPEELMRYRSDESYRELMKRLLQRSVTRPAPRRSVGLEGFMKLVAPELEENRREMPDPESILDADEASDALTEAVMDDLTFMTDEVGIQMSLALAGKALTFTQETTGGTAMVGFMCLKDGGICLNFEDSYYIYVPGLITSAVKRAGERREREGVKKPQLPQRRQPKIFGGAIKIIKKK